MKLKSTPLIARDMAVLPAESLTVEALEHDILANESCESGFVNIAAAAPPKFDTRFVVRRKGGKVAICALLCSYEKKLASEMGHYPGSIELLFDFRNDGFGYTQYIFKEGQDVALREFAPYPCAKSTSARPFMPMGFRFVHRMNKNSSLFTVRKTLFYAVFREKDLFGFGKTIGFNVCRHDLGSANFSSWSMLAGNGAPDATSLGRLHLEPAERVQKRTAPRLTPTNKFRVAVTNDSPMVVINRHYTPKSLNAEMSALATLGVRRLHWIDYSNFPAFWSLPMWKTQYKRTEEGCGNLLQAACKAARKHGVELVPDFKIFDLSFQARIGTPKQRDRIPRMGASDVLCIPEMLNAQDAFLQTNPAWRREAGFPIHTLRIYSLAPIETSTAETLKLLQSDDNRSYAPVKLKRGSAGVKKIRRPNLRWTPAGPRADSGFHDTWVLEISDLKLTSPFLKIEFQGQPRKIFNRQFAIVEAIGSDGSTAPFLCSDSGSEKGGEGVFDFFGKWPGWNNYNDHAYELTALHESGFGIALIEPPALAGVLEPTHPKSHEIWLGRIDSYLDQDIAGISIRTLCHHWRCNSWLQYAFGPSALNAFELEHGRPPEPCERDYELMRRVRGEALGDFLSEAASRIRAKKKKSIFQVETGGELPAERESRMAITYDYGKWISSGLFDELHVRSINAHSPWLRQVILPLARKHGVEVHLMTRNHAHGFGPQDLLDIRKATADARALGYHGINFYESANLYELTDADTFLPRAMGEVCLRETVQLSR